MPYLLIDLIYESMSVQKIQREIKIRTLTVLIQGEAQQKERAQKWKNNFILILTLKDVIFRFRTESEMK